MANAAVHTPAPEASQQVATHEVSERSKRGAACEPGVDEGCEQ